MLGMEGYSNWKKIFVNAKTFLEKRYNEEMELEDAIHVALFDSKKKVLREK